MIILSNGHKFNFCCASGALGFNGDGWWFEQPFRWLGLLNPSVFTIITKTLTFHAREGNLRMWCPWRCVRIGRDYVVNAVGLTNPGYEWWITHCYPHMSRKGYKTIVSLMPEDVGEATIMAETFNDLDITGIELNLSCPNVEHENNLYDIVYAFSEKSKHPVILKLSFDQPYLDICQELEGKVEAFDLINSVPWKIAFPVSDSPLKSYGLTGGVSGRRIQLYSKIALTLARSKVKTPIISGGGIDSFEEAKERFERGADAVSFGTIFLRKPWLPNQIVERFR